MTKKKKVEKSGPFIFTYTGKRFYYDSFDPSQFSIEDGAHALSLINRFAGHTRRAYPVAKHCVIACQIAPEEHKLEALMHDFIESITLDIPTALKNAPFMQGFKEYEDAQEQVLIQAFKLEAIKPGEVAVIDYDLAYLEALAWLEFDGRAWLEPEGLKDRVKKYNKRWSGFINDIANFWHPEFCEEQFIKFYNKYKRV